MAKPALSQIYKGSFKDRPRFDDGGYVSYAGTGPSAQQLATNGSGGVTTTSGGAPSLSTGISAGSLNNVSTPATPVSVPTDESNAMSSNAAANQTPSGLSKVLASLGLGGGNTSNTAALGALTGILSAAGHYAQSKAGSTLPTMPAMGALPALPGSTSTGYGPAGGYGYQGYQGANSGMAGLGYAPRTAAPSKPSASYFTYGQGPEQQYFQQVSPNGGPIAPVTGAKRGGSVKMARGGAVPHFDMGGVVPNVGGMQSVLGQGAMAQPGQTPMTPRPMPPQGGAPPMTQAGPVQQPRPPQPVPQPPRPPMPSPQAPRPPQPAPPSTMMQRMQQARPQMGRPFAEGGSTGNTPTGMPGQIPMIAPNQMAQSTSLQTQNPHTLGNVYRRGVGTSGQLPMGNHPMIQQRANGGPPDANEAANGMAANQGALSQSRHVTGPGDGTSDSIPARLANGEYVLDAQAVSMLGNGDNSAGAKRLDEFRKNLRAHKGAALAKGKMAPDAKPIHKYMGGQ